MIDINLLRENPDKIKKAIQSKNGDLEIVERILRVDKTRRDLIGKIETLRAERNKWSGLKSPNLPHQLKKGTETIREMVKKIKDELRQKEPALSVIEQELKNLLFDVPNPPAADVHFGKDESENIEVRKWGKPAKFSFKPKSYQELGESLDIVDTKTAAKVSGSRFGYLKNEGVLLELALINFVMEMLLKEKFIPVIPPTMISIDSMKGLGYMEKGGEQNMYLLEKDNLVLVATAEHSLVPMHKNEILDGDKLPLRYVGFSSSFRREAGSYGKDTQGIFRVHQFDKVEMVSFIKPQENDDQKENEYLLSLEEKIVQALNIPYQVTKMCTGDLGHPAARKYDINSWFPSEGRYRETHSVSTCTDYQARRLSIRYKDKNGNGFVHILNGTAVAIGRMILAILENYQQKDGSVEIPKVLQKYTRLYQGFGGQAGFKKIIPKK